MDMRDGEAVGVGGAEGVLVLVCLCCVVLLGAARQHLPMGRKIKLHHRLCVGQCASKGGRDVTLRRCRHYEAKVT